MNADDAQINRVLHFSRRLREVRFLTLLAALTAILLSTAHAQSPLREPTPAEKKVLEQFTDVIHPFLDTFDSDDWDTATDYDVDDNVLVSKHNDVPLDVDELIQRSYTVKNGSPLYQR